MIQRYRQAKLELIKGRGEDPYPSRFQRTHTALEAVAFYTEQGAAAGETQIALAGRLTAMREMGGASFLDLRDGSGRLQLCFRRDALGQQRYAELRDFDLGDFVGVMGKLFVTRTGELTLEVHDFVMLAKALRPPPEKWHGLRDVETRYRQRYLDLMANEEVRQLFITRSRIISAIRRFLDERGFLEVETPILWGTAGGAMARRFHTHYNALNQDLYLRIATELHLKRLLVGGYERVYEIGRIFRNEGVSTKHNPEFTSLEAYQAYADYNDMMEMVEQMVATVAQEVMGTTDIVYQGQSISLAPPWRRMTLRQAIFEKTGIDFEEYPDAASLEAAMADHSIHAPSGPSYRGRHIDYLLSAFVEPALIQPTFLLDYPVELTPLAKRVLGSQSLVERFEGFAGGLEIANAFTELNDPVEQRERFFLPGVSTRTGIEGTEELDMMDEDFLVALEHGMPPAGGLGMGIDRLVMVLTDQSSIREVILFPQLRSKE